MNRRHFLAASAALLALPAQAQIDLTRISQYMNGLRTAQGSFVQANPDGTLSQGTYYMQRPGRIRFEYNPPHPALVIADGRFVGVFDRDSNNPTPSRYPLGETPLNILLSNQVDLSSSGAVRNVSASGPQTNVTAVDPRRPNRGSITMVFTDNPVELRQWVVREADGQETTVILNDITTGVSLNNRLFNIEWETRQQELRLQ